MSVPKPVAAFAQGGRELYQPEFGDLDAAKKAKLLARLRCQWPKTIEKAAGAGGAKPLRKAADILAELHAASRQSWEEGRENYLSRCCSRAFGDTTDLMAPHAHGVPNVNEAVMSMAAYVLLLFKPTLTKHGFREDVVGLAQLDSLLQESAAADPGVAESLSGLLHELVFGRREDLERLVPKERQSVLYTGHLFWMGILATSAPTVTTFLSYIHHLALPPLERRLRSFVRTIAFSESILATKLAELRQKGSMRAVWIYNADKHGLDELAQKGYFEELPALKPAHEVTSVVLVHSVNGGVFPGKWPCGKSVRVSSTGDHANLAAFPMPETCYIFHFDVYDQGHVLTLLHMAAMANSISRPVTVLTCRCVEETNDLRSLLEHLKMESGWPVAETPAPMRIPFMVSRNLYSGMGGSPDLDFDDNGAVCAVYGSQMEEAVCRNLREDPAALHAELERWKGLKDAKLRFGAKLLETMPDYCRMLGAEEGAEFTKEHLAALRLTLDQSPNCAELLEGGYIDVAPEEEEPAVEEKKAPAPPPVPAGVEEEYKVVYARVMVRAEPSTKAAAIGLHQKDALVRGVVVEANGARWLKVKHARPSNAKSKPEAPVEAFMLIEGQSVGLGKLLERVQTPEEEEEKRAAAAAAGTTKPTRSPAVFWGILDLKFDPRKAPSEQVKVLETGDGRLSRFSGCGASIKESFQHDSRLEETIRRAALTENKKLTHDVIVGHGYGHLRPRQVEFRREYDEGLAGRIVEAFGFAEDDVCVLKLCNRQRGAGVLPVAVAELDASLQELLLPPKDVEAWLARQPKDWARSVVWGCWEEQVRHWWSNECPCFLVEEMIYSVPTEKEGALYDGTMRVGFSLHREHRNRLPPGWVHSPEGPIRVSPADAVEGEEKPPPWNDARPYLDLFRPESSHLRVQWLGGYWKLPIEDVFSPDLRAKCVSVAKQGTAPVPDAQLHSVYAAMGDMVQLLFGSNDMSQGAIRARYKAFPELASFVIGRLACSMRGDRQKAVHLLSLAETYLDKERGLCKDLVTSYLQRSFGVMQAAYQSQWTTAAEHFRRAIEAMPANASARHLLAVHYLEQNDAQKAAAVLEDVLQLDPDFKAPYACLGVARLRMSQYDAAAAISQAGLARHPFTPACHYNLGLASFAMAFLEEQRLGAGHIAQALRKQALQALESARQTRFREQPWEARDDAMVARLREEDSPLVWSERRLPCDGWRINGWRP